LKIISKNELENIYLFIIYQKKKQQMLTENNFNFFVYYVFPVVVMLMSMFGNTCGLIVMSKRKLKKIGPINIYRLLFLIDLIYSFMNMNFYLINFKINLTIYSAMSCKLLVFFGYSIAPISAMLQVIVSWKSIISFYFFWSIK